MFTTILSFFIATFFAFLDLFFSHLCSQPFVFCTLSYYVTLLYAKNPYNRLMLVFFVLMILSHFLYSNEIRLFWYLVPLTVAGSLGQRLVFSKRIQPLILTFVGMVAHKLIIDHIPLQNLFSYDCTTLLSLATLILVALISLK